MNTKQPEALRIADDLHHSITHYGAEDAFTFAAYEAEQCVRALHAENETLRTDHMQALAAHPQNAEKLPRVPLHETVKRMADRIEELQDQLEAIGAGGVEPLRKRECLHQISEPAPSASIEQEAMQMLWNDQQQEEKEHYRNVARGAERIK